MAMPRISDAGCSCPTIIWLLQTVTFRMWHFHLRNINADYMHDNVNNLQNAQNQILPVP